MDDLISRQAAIEHWRAIIDATDESNIYNMGFVAGLEFCIIHLSTMPSAQPEISRIEQELHGKTPEEQYDFIYWLLLKFALAYTDSRLAVVEWLRGEKEDE